MGSTSIEEVGSAARRKVQDPYSRFPVEGHHLVMYGKKLTRREIPDGMDGLNIEDRKRAGLFLHFYTFQRKLQ